MSMCPGCGRKYVEVRTRELKAGDMKCQYCGLRWFEQDGESPMMYSFEKGNRGRWVEVPAGTLMAFGRAF